MGLELPHHAPPVFDPCASASHSPRVANSLPCFFPPQKGSRRHWMRRQRVRETAQSICLLLTLSLYLSLSKPPYSPRDDYQSTNSKPKSGAVSMGDIPRWPVRPRFGHRCWTVVCCFQQLRELLFTFHVRSWIPLRRPTARKRFTTSCLGSFGIRSLEVKAG